MNYQENPIGVTQVPQFGWVLESDKRSVIQASYELQISADAEFKNVLFDSGEINSDESAHVFAEGFQIKSAEKYFVRAKVTDVDGECSGWSKTGYFVTALLSEEEWKAEFVSAETKENAGESKGTYVRSSFRVKGNVKAAYAFTTALGLYKFYINGTKVGTDELTPGWTSYLKHLTYQTYDITTMLKEGENGVGAMLGAGWYKGKMGFVGNRNNYGEQTAFLGQIHIAYEDGTTDTIVTDSTWKGSDAPVVFSEIYDGEIYDARLEIEGWSEAGFDANGCSEAGFKADGGTQAGYHAKRFWDVETVAFDKKVLEAQSFCKVTEVEPVTAKRIFQTPQGDTVIDFGQNMTGWIHVKVKGKAGDKVELNCFEVLDAKGNVYLDNLRGAKETLTYICKDDQETEYHPNFTFMGFQFAKIASYPGEAKIEDFTAYAVHSDMEQTGTFTCSNPEINQLQHNILWGLKGNFVDVPTDCPQRNERLGWTGDAQIFCRTASYLMNTYHFFAKWLKDVAADQTPEGGVPHVVPDILSGKTDGDWLLEQGSHSAAAWADVAVINPWTMYLTYGDKKILEDQYSSMKAWIGFMEEHAKDYIWNYKLQFGDWVALDAQEGSYFGATPNDLTCTAYFAYSTGLFVKIAKILGNCEDEKKYTALYEKIVDKFQRTFFDSEGIMTAQTQTAHIVALYFNLVPEAYREKTVEGLLRLLEKENGHLVTGFVGTPYFCHALSQNGHTKEAYELLLKDDFPSWLYQVKMGATTVWEHWDGMKPDGTMWSPDMNSFNHYAYGAIGEWLYRVAAGIEADEERSGYKFTTIYPRIGGGLDYVKANYKSVYGDVTSEWNVDGDEVTMKVCIPPNTQAKICLDQAVEVLDGDGLEFGSENGFMSGCAGSGCYHIRFRK